MSDREKPKIYIACGGSAGHIFPGLTLAEELTRRYGGDVKILFLTSDNELARSLFRKSGFDFYPLSLQGLNKGSILKRLAFISSLFRGTLASTKILFSNRPDCFVGFGSYIAGPPFVIASLLGVPTLIHEQNAVMGRANRIMQHFATKVALSFPMESKHKRKNAVFTGNPVRESAARVLDRAEAIDSLALSRNRFTILVIGGSQGSQMINSMALEMFRNMEKELRNKIQVVHISGKRDYEGLKKGYREINILHKLYPFFKDIGVIYSASNISISRAGASVIYELCAHKIPSILIPYPFAGGHQLENARFLATRGAAIMIEENGLSRESLFKEVERLVNGEDLRESIREKIGLLAASNAAERLADEVNSLL